MQRIEPTLLASKFRGALLGALVGDCCGLPFEFDGGPNLAQQGLIKQNLNKLEGEYFKAPVKQYSDDTAMTKVLASTLISRYNQKELAKNFTKEFFKEPSRGYGQGVMSVFKKLKGTKFTNPTGPAMEQFFGEGSHGNGAAMRISPVSLFCWDNLDELTRLVIETSHITHTHRLGVNGALLQAYAVHQALLLDPSKEEITGSNFIGSLIQKMEEHEKPDEDDIEAAGFEYKTQLQQVLTLLVKEPEPNASEVVQKLGHSIAAHLSVPTAIYSFLRSENPDIKSDISTHPFRTTLEYAINLGGDTDTIASMACAISGAYYGSEVISKKLLRHCEASEEVTKLADELFNKAFVARSIN